MHANKTSGIDHAAVQIGIPISVWPTGIGSGWGSAYVSYYHIKGQVMAAGAARGEGSGYSGGSACSTYNTGAYMEGVTSNAAQHSLPEQDFG